MSKPTEISPTQMTVDVRKLPNLECSRCLNMTFQEVVLFKKVSALLSPNGKAGLSPYPAFACVACGYVDPVFLPKGMVSEETSLPPKPEQPAEADRPKLILEP